MLAMSDRESIWLIVTFVGITLNVQIISFMKNASSTAFLLAELFLEKFFCNPSAFTAVI